MKKPFVFIFTAVMLVSFVFAQENDIRKLNWGMSFLKVQEIEGLKDNFYKDEEILGVKVEITFGCGSKGLYSVTYSTRSQEFAEKAGQLLNKKYGAPTTGLDYSYLVQSKNILLQYPGLVVQIHEKGDFSGLENIKSNDTSVNVIKVIKAALSKREMWQYGNTVAMLLDSPEGVVLSYWHKPYHERNKKKFDALLAEIKKKAGENAKNSDDTDKF